MPETVLESARRKRDEAHAQGIHDLSKLLTPSEKVALILEAQEKEHVQSPDGKGDAERAWGNVEEHRKRFGHLPAGFKTCERCAHAQP